MNISHTTRTVIGTVLTTLLITGTLQTVDARDREGRDGSRRHKSRTEQSTRKEKVSSDRKIKHRKQKKHHDTYAKKRHVKKEVVHHRRNKHHSGKYHDHRAPKRVVRHDVIKRLPSGYRIFSSGKNRYFYKKGRYYRRHKHGYVRVHRPRLHRLPRHARRVVIDWITYWVCDDIYYIYRDGCYEICERPYCSTSTVEFGLGPLHFIVTDHDDYCY